MYFESSKYFKEFENKKLEFSFGKFYLCDHFFISELNEGVHFDWGKIRLVMSKIIEFYGNDIKLGYISNRIHSYSIDPQSWEKVDKKYNIIVASTIIYYNNFTYKNASLEKLFSKKSIKRSINLDEAIYWINNLKELH
tara:strand:+ start:10051 stop:10464 length:414 start_codon:yes stop_codon:yes gene_type:complete